MVTDTSSRERQPMRAFYLPAMTTLSATPGRLGRFVSNLGRDRGTGRGTPAPAPSRPFYLPGMAVISNVPGRLERFVVTHLRGHNVATRAAAVGERVREFYLPATFRR